MKMISRVLFFFKKKGKLYVQKARFGGCTIAVSISGIIICFLNLALILIFKKSILAICDTPKKFRHTQKKKQRTYRRAHFEYDLFLFLITY